MTLPLIQYALPAFTGYMLFLIISGKFHPFRRPQSLTARPSWLFGLWSGVATAAVMFFVLQMVNPLALPGIKAMLPTAAALLAIAMLPGILVGNWYRSFVAMTALEAEDARLAEYDELDLELHHAMDSSEEQLPTHYDLDDTLRVTETDTASDDTLNLPPVLEDLSSASDKTLDREYDSAFEREYNRLFGISQNSGTESDENHDSDTVVADAPVAVLRWPNSQTEYDHAFTVACNSANDYLAARTQALKPMVETQEIADEQPVALTIDPDEEQLPLPLDPPENAVSPEQNIDDATVDLSSAQDEYDAAFEAARSQTYAGILARAQLPLGLDEETAIREKTWAQAYAKIDAITADFQRSLAKANSLTETEQKLRVETETHLRITRRALCRLDADMRAQKSIKAGDLIKLENSLDEKIRTTAKAESALTRELKKRSELEAELLKSKESELSARRDARKNTAARAKVLSTANKALAFARQTVDARTHAEAEIWRLKEQVKIHQDTISSLIATLDSEKSKSREEVSFLSKQLLQKEIELEKQSLTGGNLTSRLVKKVARARPVT